MPNPVTGTLLQGYSGDEGTMVGAAVLEVEEGIQYLYVAQNNGTIVKVSMHCICTDT